MEINITWEGMIEMYANLKKIKFLKKMSACLVLAGAVLVSSLGMGSFTTANAATRNTNSKVTVIDDKTKIEEFAQKNNIKLEKYGKKLDKIVIKENVNRNTEVANNKLSFGGGYYLEFVNHSKACGTEPIDSTSGTGPGTLSLNVSKSVSATWSANCGVSADVVSAGIGYSVTQSYSVSDSYSMNLSDGQSETVDAMPYYNYYTYDVYCAPLFGSDYYAGNGDAYIPSGVCFVHYAN